MRLCADEKVYIMSEEKKLHQELVQLNSILHKTRTASAKLQQEHSTAMKGKRETDEKLDRLSLFLQQTIEITAAQGSPPSKVQQKVSTVSPPSPATTTSSTATSISMDTPSSSPASAPSSSAPSPSSTKSASPMRQVANAFFR